MVRCGSRPAPVQAQPAAQQAAPTNPAWTPMISASWRARPKRADDVARLPDEQDQDGEAGNAMQVHGCDPFRVRVSQPQIPGRQLDAEQRNERDVRPGILHTANSPAASHLPVQEIPRANRHSRESGNPECGCVCPLSVSGGIWIPVFAGMAGFTRRQIQRARAAMPRALNTLRLPVWTWLGHLEGPRPGGIPPARPWASAGRGRLPAPASTVRRPPARRSRIDSRRRPCRCAG